MSCVTVAKPEEKPALLLSPTHCKFWVNVMLYAADSLVTYTGVKQLSSSP